MTTELPEKPLSRKESYLAKIAGQSVEVPEKPESRIEQYLAYIAENGGSGGGGIPTTVIDTIWFGTQDQYDAIDPKATKTLYLVQEDVETPVSLSLNSTRNVEPIVERTIVAPTIEPKDNITRSIDTPEAISNIEEVVAEPEENIEEIEENIEEEPEEPEEVEEETIEEEPEEKE